MLLEKPPGLTLAGPGRHRRGRGRAAPARSTCVFQHRHGSGARRATTCSARARSARRRSPSARRSGTGRTATSCRTGGATGPARAAAHPRPRHPPDRPAAAPDGAVDLGPGASSRLARPVEFEDVSLAMVTFASGAVGTIVTSLLSPARAQPDPDRHHRRHAGGRPPVRLPRRRLVLDPAPDGDPDTWGRSAGDDVPSNHLAQIVCLFDDLLAGRTHRDHAGQGARPTMEFRHRALRLRTARPAGHPGAVLDPRTPVLRRAQRGAVERHHHATPGQRLIPSCSER